MSAPKLVIRTNGEAVVDGELVEVKKAKPVNRVSLANVDLAAKWHHGYIPANAEALAIKEHRKPGSSPGPRAKTLADYKAYHPLATKRSMSTSDLLAHAEAHTAAAKRARTPESKARHVAEARSARLVAAKRVTKVQRKAATVKPKQTQGLMGGMVLPSTLTGKPTRREVTRAIRGTSPTVKARQSAVGAHDIGYDKMSGLEIAQAFTKAKKAGDTKRMAELHAEAQKRIAAGKAIEQHAKMAKELIDTQWDKTANNPAARNKLIGKIDKLTPGFKSRVKKVEKTDKQKLKNVEYLKAFIDEFFRVLIEQLLGPIIGSGLGAAGLAIFASTHGG